MNTEERIQKEGKKYCEVNYAKAQLQTTEDAEYIQAVSENSYISGATAEAARNKENAIAFVKWAYLNHWRYYDEDYDYWKKNSTHMASENLYDLFINEQNKKA